MHATTALPNALAGPAVMTGPEQQHLVDEITHPDLVTAFQHMAPGYPQDEPAPQPRPDHPSPTSRLTPTGGTTP